jgi:predicted molibdopterin-dependent oxidoreductase YjgC
VAGLAATLGRGAMSNPLSDMEHPDVIFCIGTNMTEAHPVAATRLKKAVANGAKLIVADPRKIGLTRYGEIHLQLRVGTDVALLLGMAHVIAREGLVDRDFIAARTEGSEEFLEHIKQFTPEWAETICGVPSKDIETAARWYAKGERGAIFYTLGITEHVCGVDNVQSLSNLALMTGNFGREGTGLNPMRGQNNIQGAGDAGALPNNYVGFQPVTDPANQKKFEQAYGRPMSSELGMTKVKALNLAGDKIKTMLIVGENTVASDPDRKHCEHALKSLDHLVCVDIFPTETTALADVVLPATAWTETDGVFTNTERRIQRVRQAVKPQGQSKPDWWILAELGKRMGNAEQFTYGSAKDVFNELCSLSPIYAGVDWDRIDRAEYQWPVPHDGHPGTPRLHEDEFPRGKGLFRQLEYRDPAEVVDDDYPVWLTTGRRLQNYHTQTMTRRAEGIDWLLPHEVVEVNPADVDAWGLSDGGWAKMASRRGEIEVRVKSTDKSQRGCVFCSFSFAETPVNNLTGGGYDPITDTAELKVCPVSLVAIDGPSAGADAE